MAQLALGVIGAAVGYVATGGTPIGAAWGWTIGSGIGGYIAQDKVEGPRLREKKVGDFQYGAAIPTAWGTIRVAGFPIYMSELDEHAREEGGKGGGGYTAYTYTGDVAVGICDGPIGTVLRIWANGILIYDAEGGPVGDIPDDDPDAGPTGTTEDREVIPEGGLTIYTGTEDQLPDATLEARIGVGFVPGYRGTAYIVIEAMMYEKFGNRFPSFEFEVTPGEVEVTEELTREEIAHYSSSTFQSPTGIARSESGHFLVMDPGDTADFLVVQEGVDTPVASFSLGTRAFAYFRPGAGAFSDYIYTITGQNRISRIHLPSLPTVNAQSYSGPFPAVDVVSTGQLVMMSGLAVPSVHKISELDMTWQETETGVELQFIQGGGGLGFHFVANNDGVQMIGGMNIAPYTINFWGGVDPDRNSVVFIDYKLNVLVELSLTSETVVQTIPVTPGTFFGYAIYEPVRKEWYTWDKTTPGDASIVAIDLATGTKRTFHVERDTGHTISYATQLWPNSDGSVYAIDLVLQENGSIDFTEGTHIGLYRLGGETQAEREGVLLSEVVTDLCVASGLETADIDVSELTDVVDGFIRPRPMAARACIEALEKAYHFDCVESDWILKFPKRDRQPVASIDEYFLIDTAGQGGEVEVVRAAELELPSEIRIKYIDFALDYDPNVQYARRETVESDHVIEVDIPVVITPDEARNAAQIALLWAWVVRDTFKFATSMKYANIDPTDVVTLPLDDYYRGVRILRQAIGQGVVEFEATFDVNAIFDPSMTGVSGGTIPSGSVVVIGDAIAYLLDIPLLRDADEGLVFYWAAAREATPNAWRGALLFKSTDGGGSFSELDTASAESAIGTATALGDWTGGNVRDMENTVDVTLTSGMTLASTSYLGLMNGANAAIIGSEIIQFQSAEDQGGNVWRLSSLLRGRRGTEWAISSHASGERFILLTTASTRRVTGDQSELNLVRAYKAMMSGQAIADADIKMFTLTGASLKPYAPVHLSIEKASDYTVSWVRRTRVGGAWADGLDVPLSEASESYEIDIYDSAFSSLKRTLTATSTSVVYSAAQIAADFGSPPAEIGVRVYQMSATVGRGYAGEAVL